MSSKPDDSRASFPRSSSIAETEESVDGYSSDFQLEESRGLRCLPSSQSLTHCLVGRNNPQLHDELPETPESFVPKKPSSLFGHKTFGQVCRETQKKSVYGKVPNYGLISVIVKSPDNLTQEQFASQLIQKFQTIFKTHNLNIWLKPFNIIATCPTGGLIETIPDAVSINQLKK